jgi:hypothetical protein
MRKSKGNLVWEFIALCNDRKAVEKVRELDALTDHDIDEWVIEAICEYQLCCCRSKSSWEPGLSAVPLELEDIAYRGIRPYRRFRTVE